MGKSATTQTHAQIQFPTQMLIGNVLVTGDGPGETILNPFHRRGVVHSSRGVGRTTESCSQRR